MQIVPIIDTASQTLRATLGGQSCTVNVYQKSTGLYCDVYVADVLVIGGVVCENVNRIVRDPYLGLIGDLLFLDTHGASNPATPGLGSRFVLIYMTAADVAAAVASNLASMVVAQAVFPPMTIPPQPSSALFATGFIGSYGAVIVYAADVACDLLLHFDESVTSLWRDYSLNHRALTLTTYGTGAIAATAAGEFGNGLLLTQQYPGDQSTLNYNKQTYIRAAGNINLGGSEWFMSASVTLNALPTNAACVMSNFEGNAGNTNGFLFWIMPSGAIAFSHDGAASFSSGYNVIAAGTKARIAVSRAPAFLFGNPDILTLFINGVAVGQFALPFGSSFQTVVQGRTFVGCYDISTTTGVENLTASFGGMIDEAYIIHGVGTGVRANYIPPTSEYGMGGSSLVVSAALAASGTSQAYGTALLAAAFTGAGIIVSNGAAILSIGLGLSASGQVQSTGAGLFGNSLALSAAGIVLSSGSASLGLSNPLIGTGTVVAIGSATFATSTALAGRGIVVATGSVTTGTSIALAGAGFVASSGAAALVP